MIKQVMVLLALSVAVASPVNAVADLASALKNGKVCERNDGYIAPTPGNEAEVAELVATVNAKRVRVYADIGAKAGLSTAAVAMAHAEEQKAKSPEKSCR